MTGNGLGQTRIPARYYRDLPRVLRDHGIDADQLLQRAQLSAARLRDPHGQLALSEIEHLVDAMLASGVRGDLALDLGTTVHLRDHNLVGYAILASPTIDYGLRLTMRFFGLIFPPFRMRYSVVGDHAEVRLTPSVAMSAESLEFHIEFVATAFLKAFDELVPGGLPEHELALSVAQPAYRQRYLDILPRTRLLFAAQSSPGICVRFPRSMLAAAPVMANRAALEVAEQRCRELLQQMIHRRSIGAWTRMMLRESSHGMPRIEELASTLNITKRTLHRHLRQEGLVYRRLCVEERERRARALLRQPQLSLTWIAQELGYSDASNFTRAFRASAGCSPQQYRERLQQAALRD